MKGISRKLVELVGSEWMLKENIVIWVIYHRSSAGYYNYKKVAILMTITEDKSNLYEEDSRNILVTHIDTGAYQEFSNPREVINAIKYLARKYKLSCRVIKLDWYYHFVHYR